MRTIQWKPCVGFPAYEVSNLGHVRNAKTKGILTPIKKERCSDYLSVNLFYIDEDGHKRHQMMLIHRLVAMAYIKNDDPIHKREVNHIDEDKENNAASNLEWCTRKYNCNYGTHRQKISEALKSSKKFQETKEERMKNIRAGLARYWEGVRNGTIERKLSKKSNK